MINFRRKQYLELYRDGAPAIAVGRNSNRHTSLVEAAEHATEHATDINQPGEYEIRIGSEVYYTVDITAITFQTSAPPLTPITISPIPAVELTVDGSLHLGQYINDPDNARLSTNVTGLTGLATYDSNTESLTGVAPGTETNLRLEVMY